MTYLLGSHIYVRRVPSDLCGVIMDVLETVGVETADQSCSKLFATSELTVFRESVSFFH